MVVQELFDRAWRARHKLLELRVPIESFHVCVSRPDWEDLQEENETEHRWLWPPSAILGLPIVVDEHLETGDVRLRCEVSA